MITRISFDFTILKAALLAASKNKTRSNLLGVFVEFTGKDLFVAATNGHMLAAFKPVFKIEGESEPFSVILPYDEIAALKKTTIAILSYDSEAGTCAFDQDGRISSFKPIDENFPAWRRVLPRDEANGQAAFFNPEYLMAFKKIAKMLGSEKFSIAFNGENPNAIYLDTQIDHVCIIMPIRQSYDIPKSIPLWANL